jgi:hypothetical protein
MPTEACGCPLDAALLDGAVLTGRLHAAGINCRYLGRVWAAAACARSRAALMTEMVARALKAMVHAHLRKQMPHVRVGVTSPYRRIVLEYLNRLVGLSPEADAFWSILLPRALCEKFPVDDEEEGRDPDHVARAGPAPPPPPPRPPGLVHQQSMNEYEPSERTVFRAEAAAAAAAADDSTPGCYCGVTGPALRAALRKAVLLKRAIDVLGVQLRPGTMADIAAEEGRMFERDAPLDDIDFSTIEAKVKRTPLLQYAQGTALFIRSRSREGPEAQRLAVMARERFDKALRVCSTDVQTLCNYGFLLEDSFGVRARACSNACMGGILQQRVCALGWAYVPCVCVPHAA